MFYHCLLIFWLSAILPVSATPSFTADYVSTTDPSGRQELLVNWEPELFGNQFRWLFSQGYRLETARTYINGSQRKWAGVFAPGTDGQYFYMGMKDFILTDM